MSEDTTRISESKRMEEALRAAEERFRTLVQFSFDVYWETDAQHRFVRQDFANALADAPRATVRGRRRQAMRRWAAVRATTSNTGWSVPTARSAWCTARAT